MVEVAGCAAAAGRANDVPKIGFRASEIILGPAVTALVMHKTLGGARLAFRTVDHREIRGGIAGVSKRNAVVPAATPRSVCGKQIRTLRIEWDARISRTRRGAQI